MLRFAYKPTNTKNPTNNIVTKNHFKITGYILCCKNLVAWRQPNYTYLHIFYTVDDDIKRWEIDKNIYDLQSVTSILSDVYIIMVSDIFPGAEYYILLGYSCSN